RVGEAALGAGRAAREREGGIDLFDPPVRRSVVGPRAGVLAPHLRSEDRDDGAAADIRSRGVSVVAAAARSGEHRARSARARPDLIYPRCGTPRVAMKIHEYQGK